MAEKWIKDAIQGGQVKHSEGRIRRYLHRVYGGDAFFKNGNIRSEYIDKAIKRVKNGRGRNKEGLLHALYLAKRLKAIGRQ